MDPYKILGIDPTASREQIETAYREKARKHHPDKGGDTWAFQQVQAAYEEICRQRDLGATARDTATESPPHPTATRASSRTKRDGKSDWHWVYIGAALFVVLKILANKSLRSAIFSAIASFVLFCVALFLWIVFTVVAGLAIAAAVAACRATNHSDRNQNAMGSALLVCICGVVWFILGWFPLQRKSSNTATSNVGHSSVRLAADTEPTPTKAIELPQTTSPEQLTAAYKSKVYYVLVNYSERQVKQYLFTNQVETAQAQVFGSGIMVVNDHNQGLIVTNRHVIDPVYAAMHNGSASGIPSNLTVQVKNPFMENFRDARIVAVHNQRDLAILLVNQQFNTSEAVRIVRMKDVRQAEPVLALGNPYGLEFFVSTGIISGTAEHMLGVTCPINQGNSGGPLFLYRHGWLAGINTLGGGQNLNFAEPAECLLPGAINAWRIHSDSPSVTRLLRLVPVANGM